jgi:hypothetical protein
MEILMAYGRRFFLLAFKLTDADLPELTHVGASVDHAQDPSSIGSLSPVNRGLAKSADGKWALSKADSRRVRPW